MNVSDYERMQYGSTYYFIFLHKRSHAIVAPVPLMNTSEVLVSHVRDI